MGRRPIGDQPMSAAERMRRMRAARRQPVMSVEEFEAERQRLQEAYGDPDNDTELLAKCDQAFAELNGKVPRDEATSAEMASSLFTVRGADYCHELVEQLLTVLHWDQSGRPDAFPYVVKRMERQETFPPTYCMARL